MESRLKTLQKAGARNIAQYNALVQEGKAPEGAEEMPYLVIVIDELADLMMVAAKEVEDSICRIAQLARAAGIHLIVATQRPSTDIITGLIKTNITQPHRVRGRAARSTAASSSTSPAPRSSSASATCSSPRPRGPSPSASRARSSPRTRSSAIVEHLKEQAEPDYHEEILHLKVAAVGGGVDAGDDDDPLLWEAADIVVTSAAWARRRCCSAASRSATRAPDASWTCSR